MLMLIRVSKTWKVLIKGTFKTKTIAINCELIRDNHGITVFLDC